MGELNLLEMYPNLNRDVEERFRNTSDEDRRLAKQFGREYYDGTRYQGYGGYRYDGRWKPIVDRFIRQYGLSSSSRILDIGCAKGFMLHDFREALPGVEVTGIEVSQYALDNALPSVRPFLQLGNAKALPFADRSFDLVIAINTIHNLQLPEVKTALREMTRVSRGHMFLVVDAWRTDEEKARLLKWNLTAVTYMSCSDWEAVFRETGYTGDYYWFIP